MVGMGLGAGAAALPMRSCSHVLRPSIPVGRSRIQLPGETNPRLVLAVAEDCAWET